MKVQLLLQDAEESLLVAPVEVKFSPSLLEPGLVGILAPVILLPRGIDSELSPAELRAVLDHELYHWRRRDNLLAAIHMTVEALFWFFPLVWWLGARLNAEREQACDEGVLSEGNDPQVYTDGILKVCGAYLRSPLQCVAGVSGAELKLRIVSILEARLIQRVGTIGRFVLSTTAISALAFPVVLGLLTSPIAPVQAKAEPLPLAVKRVQNEALTQSDAPLPFNSAPAATHAEQQSRATDNALSPLLTRLLSRKFVLPSQDWSHFVAPVSPDLFASNGVNPMTSQADSNSSTTTSERLLAAEPISEASHAVSAVPASTTPSETTAGSMPVGTTGSIANCASPTLVNSLPMEMAPGSSLMTIAATINGSRQKLLVDIGTSPTQIWKSQASKLGLAVEPGTRYMDLGGRPSQEVARVEKFAFGSMETGGFYLRVSSNPELEQAAFDGIIGTNMMHRYDVDLDFAHGRMNYFLPEQCKGAGIYWYPSTITSIPMASAWGLVYVPVTLDGHVLAARLDTSADRTFLNPQVAAKLFGIGPNPIKHEKLIDGGALIDAGIHTFNRLSLGGLTANDPQIAIATTSQTSDALPDIVIGMDLLKHSHLYISFQNQRVYISAAGDGPALQASPAKISWLNVWPYPAYESWYWPQEDSSPRPLRR